MSKRKSGGSISAKGYYIALILCAIAIGISGYLYYRNVNDTEQQLQKQKTEQKDDLDRTGKDVQTVAPPSDGTDDQNTTQDPNNQSGADTQQPAQKPDKTKLPVAGQTVTEYSMDALCYNQTTRDWRVHSGVDYAAEAGTSVCAAADGTVTTIVDDETMGMTVVISHEGGYSTSYSSLDEKVSVALGDKVTLGQTIGTVGQTALLESAIGDHVHFSVSCNGKLVDPAEFLSE